MRLRAVFDEAPGYQEQLQIMVEALLRSAEHQLLRHLLGLTPQAARWNPGDHLHIELTALTTVTKGN